MLLEGPPPFKADSEGASLGTNASHTPRVLWCVCGGGHPSFLADHGTACSGLGQAPPST